MKASDVEVGKYYIYDGRIILEAVTVGNDCVRDCKGFAYPAVGLTPFEWITPQCHAMPGTTKSLIEEKLAKAQAAVALLQDQLAYLAESGKDTIDDTDFKCYKALKLAQDTSLPLLDRARAFRTLIGK